MKLDVHADIRCAMALPAEVYTDQAFYLRQLERVFATSWHVLARTDQLPAAGHVTPRALLPGSLDEAVLLTREQGGALHCVSNVCTHRGNILVTEACAATSLRCRYHGRRFRLDGELTAAPGFEDAASFPSPSDSLPRVPLFAWGPLVFAALRPAISFEDLIAPVRARIGWALEAPLAFDPASSRAYEVAANWALYCDNYLEGFHVPFVHAGLSTTLEQSAYATETFSGGVLQVGVGRAGAPILELPQGHADRGRGVVAYYVWLFPATMVNVYPWGLSVNVVQPLAVDRTRVEFVSFVGDASRRTGGPGSDLHGVELEDEAVVEAVQRGVSSRLYRRGRYAPTREVGVHHFHRLLVAAMAAR